MTKCTMTCIIVAAAVAIAGCCGEPVPPLERAWRGDGDVYDFDGVEVYGVNLVDPDALTVIVPDATEGYVYQIRVTGAPYAEHIAPDVTCHMQIHATDDLVGRGTETPVSGGGAIEFPLVGIGSLGIDYAFVHMVTATGQTRFRLLGKVSRHDRFCGIGGSAAVVVTR